MKVKDLIKLLEKQNPDANIFVACEGYCNAFDSDKYNKTRLAKIDDENLVLKDGCHTTIEISVHCEDIKEA